MRHVLVSLFTDMETGPKRDKVTHPRSHSSQVGQLGLTPGVLALRSVLLTTLPATFQGASLQSVMRCCPVQTVSSLSPYLEEGGCTPCGASVLLVAQRVQFFANPWTVARLLCPWDPPGKNTGVGRHFLLQVILLTQGSKPQFLRLLHQQTDSLPSEPAGASEGMFIICRHTSAVISEHQGDWIPVHPQTHPPITGER